MENKDRVFSELEQLFTSLYQNMTSSKGEINGDITLSQFHVIKLIALGMDTATDLSQKMRISPAAVSKLVDHLDQSNLLCRIRSEEDRRIVRLELTQRGKIILKENLEKRQKILKEVLTAFTDEEISLMKAMIEKIVERMYNKESK